MSPVVCVLEVMLAENWNLQVMEGAPINQYHGPTFLLIASS